MGNQTGNMASGLSLWKAGQLKWWLERGWNTKDCGCKLATGVTSSSCVVGGGAAGVGTVDWSLISTLNLTVLHRPFHVKCWAMVSSVRVSPGCMSSE